MTRFLRPATCHQTDAHKIVLTYRPGEIPFRQRTVLQCDLGERWGRYSRDVVAEVVTSSYQTPPQSGRGGGWDLKASLHTRPAVCGSHLLRQLGLATVKQQQRAGKTASATSPI
ncbi:hypothetical protein BaRGS_00009570 [Batillaria attramentaria]|uniref:Uncharacterized protein n=1 Tax=Batillaria attramentaria TaxID=370345 RepID=A0ABD0LIL1_9CAEN